MDAADPEERFWRLAEPALARLNAANGHWDALSPEEQEIAALWKLLADMANGGFLQFFCNWGHSCYLHATRGLARLGASQALACVEAQYAVVEPLGESVDRQGYWDLPRLLTEEQWHRLDAGDRAFDAVAEDVLQRLVTRD